MKFVTQGRRIRNSQWAELPDVKYFEAMKLLKTDIFIAKFLAFLANSN